MADTLAGPAPTAVPTSAINLRNASCPSFAPLAARTKVRTATDAIFGVLFIAVLLICEVPWLALIQ